MTAPAPTNPDLSQACPSCGAEPGKRCTQWRPELGRVREIWATHWDRTPADRKKP
ncbi:hypothetical protein UQW22_10010 [Isoptericola halotolerans]|uniref:zinc finger domain-containing protein n=1 Tax=Isoptericola halotolerans TaxID=300560 RepID=UPI0038907CF2